MTDETLPELGRSLADPSAELQAIRSPRKALRRRLWLWKIGGRLEPLLMIPRREIRVASARQLIGLAAMAAEAGLIGEAVERVERARFWRWGILRRSRYPGLVTALYRAEPLRYAHLKQEAEAAERFLAAHGRFRELLEQNAGSICIVGNAPTEIGKGDGPFIDSHRLVIRFNNYDIGQEFSKDYGKKTDVWVRGNNFVNVWRRMDQRHRHQVVASNTYWRVENAHQLISECDAVGQSVEGLPPRPLYEITARLGARPSAGMKIIYFVSHVLGGLDGVTVRGFAPGAQRDGIVHYFRDRRISAVPHDWRAEQRLLEELIGRQEAP